MSALTRLRQATIPDFSLLITFIHCGLHIYGTYLSCWLSQVRMTDCSLAKTVSWSCQTTDQQVKWPRTIVQLMDGLLVCWFDFGVLVCQVGAKLWLPEMQVGVLLKRQTMHHHNFHHDQHHHEKRILICDGAPSNMRLQCVTTATCSGEQGGWRGRKALRGGPSPLAGTTSEPGYQW